MQSTKIIGSGVVVAVIGLTIAALAYANAQGTVAGHAMAASTAREAAPSSRLEVEAEIARAGLLGKMKAALGSAFGGEWFEPSTAQLHVGVTSAASRQAAEAVAAQAGLAGNVTATPVHSTWEQLIVAQERWSQRLAHLLGRAEAATALRAKYNSVEVELGSEVPSPERAELERKASAADVNVSVAAGSSPHLRLERDSRCNEFAAGKAYCDPTIVGGVTIQSEKGNICSAGPAVFPQDDTKPTETYLLTAGHCIQNGGKVGGKWYAFNKLGEKEEIGKAIEYFNNKIADVGVIKVENLYWTNKGFIPVNPTVAPWNEKAPEPYAVVAEQEPAEGLESCMSGEATGTSCGVILKLNVEVLGTKGLVEVGATRAEGDSGAPWYSKGAPGIIEGTHVGSKGGNAAFEPLATTLKELVTKLQLLTENNEFRHPFIFEAESAPVTLTGKGHSGSAVFVTTAGTTTCKESTYTGSLPTEEGVEFELTPAYFGCTMSGQTASIDMNGCKYRFAVTKLESFNREGRMDIVCPEGKEITITASVGEVTKCTIHVRPQVALRPITYTNVGTGTTREITIDVGISKFAYAHTAGTGIGACATGAAENGTLTTAISVTAENGAGGHVGFFSP